MRDIQIADWVLPEDEPEDVPVIAPALYDPDFDYTQEPEIEPEDVPGTITLPEHDQELASLRGYQNRAAVKTFGLWKAGTKSCLIVHPTGSGKTHTGSAIVARYQHHFGPRADGGNRRALILDHRDYLLDQWARTLMGMGVDSAIEKGKKKARAALWGDPDCVVASVQSMQANEVSQRLRGWEADYFDLIVVDEAHHVLTPMYRRILNHFDWVHLLGLTATPDRLDGRKLGEVFDEVSDEYLLDQAIEDGWVCGIQVAWCDVSVDISDVKSVGKGKHKDLNEADLSEKIKPYVEKFARAIKRVVGDRQIVLFAPSVFISEKMSDALTSIGIRSEHLDAKSKNREVVINAYRGKEYQCLCNYGLFTEGFDVPGIGAVVLLRATESRALYYQMIGRGLRPNDGERLLVVDFPWVSGNHKLIKPADIFGGSKSRYTEETIREAEKLLDVGAVDDLLDAIKQADQEVYERNRYKLGIEDGPVRFRKIEYNPLNTSEREALPKRPEAEERKVLAATFKQVAILKYNGIAGAESMSKRRASAIISTIKRREKAGKAPYPQVKRLVDLGIPRSEAREMKATEAERIIAAAREYGPNLSNPPNPSGIASAMPVSMTVTSRGWITASLTAKRSYPRSPVLAFLGPFAPGTRGTQGNGCRLIGCIFP